MHWAAYSVVKVELVPVWHIDGTFDHIAEGLQISCQRGGGEIDAPYLYRECRSAAAVLIVSRDDIRINGAAVLRFENWTGKSVLRILALWCDGEGVWDALNTKTHEIGKTYGVTSLIAEGRKGWERRYPNARIVRQLYEVSL